MDAKWWQWFTQFGLSKLKMKMSGDHVTDYCNNYVD
jgi:hypothetical protein